MFEVRIGRVALAAGIAVSVFLFLLGVWPTPFRYDHVTLGGVPGHLVRINRWTASVDVFMEGGWTRMEQLR